MKIYVLAYNYSSENLSIQINTQIIFSIGIIFIFIQWIICFTNGQDDSSLFAEYDVNYEYIDPITYIHEEDEPSLFSDHYQSQYSSRRGWNGSGKKSSTSKTWGGKNRNLVSSSNSEPSLFDVDYEYQPRKNHRVKYTSLNTIPSQRIVNSDFYKPNIDLDSWYDYETVSKNLKNVINSELKYS